MSVASLELCRKVHELSGWGATEYKWCHTDKIGAFLLRLDHPKWRPEFYETEAYDLGYLLQAIVDHSSLEPAGVLRMLSDYATLGDNFADAACRMAIHLFEDGILEKAA